MDSIVISSNEDPESLPLVEFYERLKEAGAKDVVVAREAERTRISSPRDRCVAPKPPL